MANIFSVTNSEELMQALASANGGDTIELTGGDYGHLELWDGRLDFIKYDAPVTITSADPSARASFSEIGLHGASNITFDNIILDYNFSDGDPLNIKAFEITNSSNISVVNSTFDGDLVSGTSTPNDGFGAGFGLSVRDSSGVFIENNEFYNWHRAGVFGQTTNVIVSGNEVYEVSSDGFDFAAVNGVLIENNYFHDFRKSDSSGSHMDMIQFWTSGTNTPITDVIIRGNILDTGDGDSTQSIFMRNERVDSYGDGPEMFYQNILIEENTIYNGHIHGITVGETNGLIIRNNTLVEAEGGQPLADGNVSIPTIRVASESTSVQITQNAVFSITGYKGQSDWVLQNNAFIQNNDSNLPGYYGEVFVSSSMDASSGQHNFIAAPGEMLDLLNAGSSLTKYTGTPSELTAMFNVNSYTDVGLVFDASLTNDSTGTLSSRDARFTWDFGDGSTADGLLINHVYSEPGYYDVNLTVTLPDGTSSREYLKVGVSGEDLLEFNSETGAFISLAYGVSTNAEADIKTLVTHESGHAFVMGGNGVSATVGHEEFSKLFGADNFELSLSLKATNGSNSGGELFRVHGHFLSFVNDDGSFSFIMGADDGSKVKLITSGVNLVDGHTHDLSVVFDGPTNTVSIWVDGVLNKTGGITGNLTNSARDLTFGDPWGGDAFDGEISGFSLSSQRNDYSLFEKSDVDLRSSTAPSETTIQPVDTPAVEAESSSTPEQPIDGETPTEESSSPEAPQGEDSGAVAPILRDGYKLDIAGISSSDAVQLYDNAHIVDTSDGLALSFDGKRDFAALGRLTEFEASQKIAFSVDFTSHNTTNRAERLVWNHEKIGIAVEGDGVRVHVGNTSSKFDEGFLVTGLGLKDGNQHSATVMVDAETDRLQIIIDDVLVLEKDDVDFDFVGAGGHEWGWSLGTSWNRWFEGEVYDFQVSDDFDFVDQAPADEGVFLT